MKTLDILTAVRAAGFTEAKYISADVDFAKPMLNWLTGTFYDFYKSWRSDYGFDTWSNKLDCDNFSSMFYCFAQLCHSKSDRSEQGIAVGEMFYLIDGDKNRGHAINIAITDAGVVTIEPQTGKVLKLTDIEKKSCWFIRF